MERQEFLRLLGAAGLAVCAGCTLESCANNNAVPSAPTNVDFTLDLTASQNAALLVTGGYLYHGGLIVVCLNASTKVYDAVSQACTHEGTTVVYQAGSNQFYCASHGSRFNTAGGVVSGPAPSALQKYNTTLTGTSLRVFS